MDVKSVKHIAAFRVVSFLTVLITSASSLSFAAVSYDPYAPVPPEEVDAREADTRRSEFIRPVGEVGALPFDVLKLAMDPLLYGLETYKIPRKVEWIYDELKEHGVKPRLLQGGYGGGAGVEVELVKLFRQKERWRHLKWENELNWAAGGELFEFLSEIALIRIADGPFSIRNGFHYQHKREEDFWGIGPDTILATGANFDQSDVQLYSAFDYDINDSTVITYETRFQHTKINNGHDDHMNFIKNTFPRLPGINGDDELAFILRLEHDRRDRPRRPTRGYLGQISYGYHHGVAGSNVRYFKYTANAAWFWPVFSDRRVLAVRFYGEHNSELDGDDVPFFNKTRLGGHFADPDVGAPLRSFKRNRFIDNSVVVLNVEYRYNIWDYREFKLDSVIFWDEGEVFDKFSEWQMRDLQGSYGFGFRFFVEERNLVSIEAARGDEGTAIYARSGTIF